ncbi:hypothetical protein SRHO_G00216230 [Serrasalmus rhombeus]
MSTTPTKGRESDTKEVASRLSCGATISGKDPHPLCIVCMGTKHAQAALANLQTCSHCALMPQKIRERRLQVAVANGQDPYLPGATAKATDSDHQPRALEGDEDSDGIANSDLLDGGDIEEDEEDDSTLPAQQSRPPSATDTGPQADSNLYVTVNARLRNWPYPDRQRKMQRALRETFMRGKDSLQLTLLKDSSYPQSLNA